ncbi:PREDICTED: uncharacterized protein LOC109480253 [Branchiostoma belcheri]|uniref:Uncharacterized protein LOC109480253 n=1 Tax=Branchiostoma belcheri TaxID=7741 RepID=A0A6P4Z9B3_BRABE|nr:PREDICTED: uncharacterized protein LOC109480253 [Branchiostoma belcheri]
MSSYQTTYDEPLGIVPHQVYVYASQIYHRLYHKRPSDQESLRYGNPKGSLEINHVEDEDTRRQTFKLAYAALKYQDLLEDVIIESGFQSSNPLPQESMCLTVVAFYVLMNQKFYLPRRHRRGPVIDEVQEVQDALQSAKTGLNATLARLRIRDRILTIDSLLPENIRNRDKYARTEVVAGLEEDGFKAPDPDDEEFTGRVYKKLLHFSDTLIFPGENKERLRDHPLVQNGSLILQDRSVAMPAYTIKSLLSLSYLMIYLSYLPQDRSVDMPAYTIKSLLSLSYLMIYLSYLPQVARPPPRSEREPDTPGPVRRHACLHHQVSTQPQLSNDISSVIFPRLRDHPLVQNGSLILQDRSVAMPAYTIKSLLSLSSGCDVICTHAGSGHLAAHVWALLDREEFQVFAMGARTPEQAGSLRSTVSQLGMQHVKVLQENFSDMRPDDPRMQNLQEENEEALAKAQEQMNPVINRTPGLLPFKVRPSPLPIAKTSQDPTYVKFPMSSEMNGCFVGILERKGDTRELLARAQKFDLGI